MRKRIIALFTILAGIALPVAAVAPQSEGWHPVKVQSEGARSVAKDADTEVLAAKGAIVVKTAKPVEVEVYTILGQLVSRHTVPVGTSQLEMPSRGVYIVRVGTLTGKVAL